MAAPPGVAALVARVQGKAEGPPVLFEETLKVRNRRARNDQGNDMGAQFNPVSP